MRAALRARVPDGARAAGRALARAQAGPWGVDGSTTGYHLFESYIGFGESAVQALEHAARRMLDICEAADRLAAFPFRGTLRNDVLPGVRHLAIGRAIYWFDVDEAAHKVRILAVFFGGQDHVRHMLVRLLRQDEPR